MLATEGTRHGPALGWLVAGYTGLAGFLVLKGVVRERGGASSLEDSVDDQGTTRLIADVVGWRAPLVVPESRAGHTVGDTGSWQAGRPGSPRRTALSHMPDVETDAWAGQQGSKSVYDAPPSASN